MLVDIYSVLHGAPALSPFERQSLTQSVRRKPVNQGNLHFLSFLSSVHSIEIGVGLKRDPFSPGLCAMFVFPYHKFLYHMLFCYMLDGKLCSRCWLLQGLHCVDDDMDLIKVI